MLFDDTNKHNYLDRGKTQVIPLIEQVLLGISLYAKSGNISISVVRESHLASTPCKPLTRLAFLFKEVLSRAQHLTDASNGCEPKISGEFKQMCRIAQTKFCSDWQSSTPH